MSFVFFFKQKTAYEMRISDWSSDVCSSDLHSVNDAAPLIQDACAFKLFSGDEIELVRRDLLGRLEDGGCHPGDERLPDASLAAVLRAYPGYEIGRASCRERVCKYG